MGAAVSVILRTVGTVIEFTEAPGWLERLEGRGTTGRIVVRPPSAAP